MDIFTSFAQNYEDVVLWRALRNIENGFYIDCGAYSPSRHSVTKAFYDRGWHGINIEPVPHLLRAFDAERPRDINLNVALSDNSDGAKFYEIFDTGLSTINPAIVQKHIDAGFVARSIDVRTERLSDVLATYPVAEIHFLKIDVEGAERLVMEGLDLASYRPWIVIVEAVRPLTQDQNHFEWEGLLLAQRYDFAYFDGLNRFYVAQEHHDLCKDLAIPPNIFDNFVQVEVINELEAARQNLAELKNSSSWRLTAPMRSTMRAFRAVCENFPRSFMRFIRNVHLRRIPARSWISQLFKDHAKNSTAVYDRAFLPKI